MSKKIILITLSLISLLALMSCAFPKASVLSEEKFSLNLKCSIPMLGVSFAEFQVSQNKEVIALVDVDKTFKEFGIENNQETNPSNAAYLNLVYKKDINKIGLFWQNTKNEVFVSQPENNLGEMTTACAIWLKDFMTIAKSFENASSASLEKDEGKFGNSKFNFEDKEKQIVFGYIFQDENLTAITQIRPPLYGLLANLIAFAGKARKIEDADFVVIPEGIEYQDVE